MSADAEPGPGAGGRVGVGPEPDEGRLDLVHRVALASLPMMGPVRLAALVAMGSVDAWEVVRRGGAATDRRLDGVLGSRPGALADRWRQAARQTDPCALWSRHEAAGVRILDPGSDPLRTVFDGDPNPPSILFGLGDPIVPSARVAVVGTRDCTRSGRDLAFRLGHELARAGVAVVSGLALGIDGAAHAGALVAGDGAAGVDPTGGAAGVDVARSAAPPVGVVGSGLDVVYPRDHRSLWHRVAAVGLLLSEYPLGTPPVAWHFPSRNRLIAALSRVVVVVESHGQGGSLHTVDEALVRDVTVMAVPGSVHSPASAGTNRLLRDGAAVACGPDDVLTQLSLTGAWQPPARRSPTADDDGATPADAGPPTGLAGEVLRALRSEPASLDQVAIRTANPVADVAVVLADLVDDGLVVESAGWFERTHRRR